MAFEFKFPDVGEGIAEGEIVKWLVKEGDIVKADQVIVKVETDKAVVDLPSPSSGKVIKINYKEGQKVPVGEVLVLIGSMDEKIKDVAKKEDKKNTVELNNKNLSKRTGSVVGQLEEAPEEELKTQISAMSSPPLKIPAHILASPAVKKYAAESGINLTTINGSGPNGEVLRKDVEKKAQDIQSIPQQNISVRTYLVDKGYEERIPLKGIRMSIANNIMKSLSGSAQVTFMEDIDVTRLSILRDREKQHLEEKNSKIKLTFMPFIIKASVAALRENPLFNSSIDGDEIIIKKYFNIGIAVETDVGLMVPIINNADQKSMIEIADEITLLASKAKERSIKPQEMQGGTFTITNYGSVGGTYATPIINPGESAILGSGKIFERIVPSEIGMGFRVAKILPISFTFDHRIADGAQAARFLESLKNFLENPDSLLMELH